MGKTLVKIARNMILVLTLLITIVLIIGSFTHMKNYDLILFEPLLPNTVYLSYALLVLVFGLFVYSYIDASYINEVTKKFFIEDAVDLKKVNDALCIEIKGNNFEHANLKRIKMLLKVSMSYCHKNLDNPYSIELSNDIEHFNNKEVIALIDSKTYDDALRLISDYLEYHITYVGINQTEEVLMNILITYNLIEQSI